MRYKLTFFVGVGVGYVLGARAGRERYEQIMRSARRVSDNPSVQETAGLLQAQASGLTDRARRKVGDKFGDRVPGLRRRGERESPMAAAADVRQPGP